MADNTSIPIIVQGNSFSLAIPLQIYVIEDGEMVLQDYTPDPTDDVSIQLKGTRRNYTYTPSMAGNIATIDLSGNELADNYAVVVSIVKTNGQRLRSFRTDQFFIVESSDDLTQDDIIAGLEENVIYLNAQAFIAGADGRGIEGIQKTGTSGLVDTYTIYYTDNTTSTFQVTNGEQGAQGVGITSIEKTGTSGLVDTYTITLSNGQTSTFEVTNGHDGVDLGLVNLVNNLTEGGEESALSAEMGKVIKECVQTIFDSLGEFAFPNGKPEISWGDTPTPPTPPTPTAYDAEIEYLESSGTQYIDTLQNLQTVCSTYIKMSITKAISSNAMVFGAWMDGSNSTTPKAQIYIDASQQWAYSRTANIGVTGITSGAAVSLNTIYEMTATTQAQTNDLKAYLFARNNDGNEFLPIDGMRLYGCTMTKDNELVRDFIPVRVGQVGYLYDRVSGELFGNAGSGNFILGNDKNS